MLPGLDATPEKVAEYLPPPFVSVPISAFVEVTYAFSVALAFVLVASTRSSRFAAVYSARVTETVPVAEGGGGGGGAALGLTVSVRLSVTPAYAAVIVTAVVVLTAFVVTSAMLLCDPAGIVSIDGNEAAALELDSETTAPPLGATVES